MPQYMGVDHTGWTTICPQCDGDLDWRFREAVDDCKGSMAAYFRPSCHRCRRENIALPNIEYTGLSSRWQPREAGELPKRVKGWIPRLLDE